MVMVTRPKMAILLIILGTLVNISIVTVPSRGAVDIACRRLKYCPPLQVSFV